MANIIVVGGGLAGLSAAALLSRYGHQVTLLEKMGEPGGRCMITEKDGFRLNFGAHAVYGRDRSYLQQVLDELKISLAWASPDPDKVRYEYEPGKLTKAPLGLGSVLATKVLPRLRDKRHFVSAVLHILSASTEQTKDWTLDEWLKEKSWSQPAKRLLLSLAGSNFFTLDPKRLDASRVIRYYKRLFRSKYPVSYLVGGWGALVRELIAVVEKNGGQIITKAPVSRILFAENRVIGVEARKTEYAADYCVCCIPAGALEKICVATPLHPLVQPFAKEPANTVLVYDVALKKRIRNDISYVADPDHRAFVTDPSLSDPSCAPEHGQLLQAIAYVPGNTQDMDESAAAELIAVVEGLLDRHYAGWRDELLFKRVLERATVQATAPYLGVERLPQVFPQVANCFFAGDGCEGEGSVSDTAFFTALSVAARLAAKA